MSTPRKPEDAAAREIDEDITEAVDKLYSAAEILSAIVQQRNTPADWDVLALGTHDTAIAQPCLDALRHIQAAIAYADHAGCAADALALHLDTDPVRKSLREIALLARWR